MRYGDIDVHDPATQIPDGTKPLFDYWMRDPQVCVAPDGWYYLTGTTLSPQNSNPNQTHSPQLWNDGLRLWRSKDLVAWEPLGLVWSLDRDATWQRWFQIIEGDRVRFVAPEEFQPAAFAPGTFVLRSLWAPEIHYVPRLRTFVVIASMNYSVLGNYDIKTSPYVKGGIFILKSNTGRAEGPYEPTSPGPLCDLIDGNLWQDDDAIWLLGLNDHLMQLTPDLGAVAGDYPRRRAVVSPDPKDIVEYVSLWDIPKLPQRRYDPELWAEGGYLFRHDGRYHLCFSTAARLPRDGSAPSYGPPDLSMESGPYNVIVASADRIEGPYGERYTAIVHGGHGNFFADRTGRWWACAFNPPHGDTSRWCDLPACRPVLVPMRWENGRIKPDHEKAAQK